MPDAHGAHVSRVTGFILRTRFCPSCGATYHTEQMPEQIRFDVAARYPGQVKRQAIELRQRGVSRKEVAIQCGIRSVVTLDKWMQELKRTEQ